MIYFSSFSAIFGHTTKPTSNETWDFWTAIRYKDGNLAAPRYEWFFFNLITLVSALLKQIILEHL